MYRNQLHKYQSHLGVPHILNHLQSMLWLDLGLGKTIVTLTAIVDLMNRFQIYGVLVVAPLRVAQTVWKQEAMDWEHTRHLTFSLIHGEKRHKEWSLRRKANVYLLNYEGIPWAIDQFINYYLARGRPLPFNMLVMDEITRLKSTRLVQGGVWGRSLRKIIDYVPRRAGLTATLTSNGLPDLFGQYLMLDDGASLGTSYNNYTTAYFNQGFNSNNLEVKPEGHHYIMRRIAPKTLRLKVEDHLDLPPVMENDVLIQLPPKLKQAYKKFDREMILMLEGQKVLSVDNAAALSGKCRQFVNGAIYDNLVKKDSWALIHDLKLDALMEIIQELDKRPLLLGYQFRHDKARIEARLKKEGIVYVVYDRRVKGGDTKQLMDRWNKREIHVILGHGQSIGHGLNMQYGSCNVGWFGTPWSYEVYKQFNGRIALRQGQKYPVRIHRIFVEDSVDMLVKFSLEGKEDTESNVEAAIQKYRKYMTRKERMQ